MKKINIGKIVTTRGIRGEIKIFPHTNVTDMFDKLKTVYIGENEEKIEFVKHIKGCVSVKLGGVDTPEEAQKLVGKQVFVDEKMLPSLEENSFYLKDIIGCDVKDAEENFVGKITDVIFTGANDVYEITSEEDRKILVPAVKEFILNVDIKNKLITVNLIEGM